MIDTTVGRLTNYHHHAESARPEADRMKQFTLP